MIDPKTTEKSPTAEAAVPDLLGDALRRLVKLIKAARYYPPGHPALKAAVRETHQCFAPLLAGESLALKVRKSAFLLGESPVAPGNPVVKELAPFLFARRIQRLLLLPDLSQRDLLTFVRCLIREPQELLDEGGIQEVLFNARVSTLGVNETDLSRLMTLRKEAENDGDGLSGGDGDDVGDFGAGEVTKDGGNVRIETVFDPEQLAADALNLEQLLDRLKRESSDERYQLLLQRLPPLVRRELSEAGRPLVVEAFSLLCRNFADRRLSLSRREHTLLAIDTLSTDEILDMLIGWMCIRDQEEKRRDRLVRILVFLKAKATGRLMERLVAEQDVATRRMLADVVARQGAAALPGLLEHLGDSRWYVVRNVVAILGDIRDQSAASHLTPLLSHPELRVRRETIRALTSIGGSSAVGILQRTIEEGDAELARQAILSLGAMKSAASVPILVQLVNRMDPLVKIPELKKSAIRALGAIGSSEAVPALAGILKRPKLWRRGKYAELKAAAAAALGAIGGDEAAAALAAAVRIRTPAVSSAAAQALRQIKRGEDHGHGPV